MLCPWWELPCDHLKQILAAIDIQTILNLQYVSHQMYDLTIDIIEERCKMECFTTYLTATLCTYRMMSNVPSTWRQLFQTLDQIEQVTWTACKQEGTASTLHKLQTDKNEYTTDIEAQILLKSGGHYSFHVAQTSLKEACLSMDENEKAILNEHKELSCFISKRILNFGNWERVQVMGLDRPFLRRHHTLSCVSTVDCTWDSIFKNVKLDISNDVTELCNNNSESVTVRRCIVFGGQSEYTPYNAYNDVHVLLIFPSKKIGKRVKNGAWVRPNVLGTPPSARCGHTATNLNCNSVIICGGSNGTQPIPYFDMFVLDVIENGGIGEFQWSSLSISPAAPFGRAFHSVYKKSKSNFIIFGGRQISSSNGLLEVFNMDIIQPDQSSHMTIYCSSPHIHGSIPTNRRGHATTVIGRQLLLCGGEDNNHLHNDVRILDATTGNWRLPIIKGTAQPCPRRGFKWQNFGTSFMMASGFTYGQDATVPISNTNKKNLITQLPPEDIFNLKLY